jgi:hypothetical protein
MTREFINIFAIKRPNKCIFNKRFLHLKKATFLSHKWGTPHL